MQPYKNRIIKGLAKIMSTDDQSVVDLIEKDEVIRAYFDLAMSQVKHAYADAILTMVSTEELIP